MSFLQPFSLLFSDDPLLRGVQVALVCAGFLAIFLVFFATRDIILRTHSFLYQCVAILLVALLPGIGFLLYLLIRPSRTLKERELEAQIRTLLEKQKTVGEVESSS